MEEIVIEIDEDGNVSIEGKGFVGPECETLTADIETALGDVKERKRKPEYARRAAAKKVAR